MKKNNMLRIASVLLVAVLLSTCAISGAFAKYVTGPAGASDSARVARFGITLEANDAMGLFDKTYAKNSETEIAYTVVSEDTVVAPGTTKTLASYINLTEGDREVAVKVEYAATVTLTGWEVNSVEYCPLEITVGTTTYKVGATVNEVVIADVDTLITEVEKAVAAASAEYAVGTPIAADAEPTITWNWAFEGNDDVNDTKLGEAGTAEVSIAVTAKVTQID